MRKQDGTNRTPYECLGSLNTINQSFGSSRTRRLASRYSSFNPRFTQKRLLFDVNDVPD